LAREAKSERAKGQGGQWARRGIQAVRVGLRVLVMAGTLAAASVYPVAESVAAAFPVVYSANGRYLTDQNGVPFPIMGRTAWFVLSLTASGYQTFVDDTASRGYSAIELHVVNHDPRGNNPPFNGDGELPFLKRLDGGNWTGALFETPDFTTPNEAYWSFVDGFLAYCESKGLLVFLFPAYVGYQGGDQGWMREIVANGTAKMQAYGAWIATRYKDQKNLVWMMGGDMGTPPDTFTTVQRDVQSALLTGLKSVAGQQSTLFSAEWDSESIATDQTDFGAAMTLNGAYSWGGDVSNQGRRAYAYGSVRPAFLLEEPYDEEGPDGNGVNGAATQPVRRFQWWGWLSTIGGYISGNGYVWMFRPSPVAWQDHLDTQGSRDMARLNAFIGSIAWYNLVPSSLGGMKTLVTAGGSSVNAADYVAAAATPSGTLLVAYVPPAHSGSITVDMTAMSGPATARWFDPTSGVYTDIGTGLANTGTHAFTPPDSNSAGAADWVLVLEVSAGVPALAVRASGVAFHSGDSFQLDLLVANPGPEAIVDLYLGAVLPPRAGPGLGCQNGDPIVFFGDSFARVVMTCLSASPENFVPFARNIILPAGLLLTTVTNVLSFNWQADFPVGPYALFAALTRAGSMEVRTVDMANATFEP
jgi:hypothetical protein